MTSKPILLLVMLASVISACGPTGGQVASAAGPQIWLDAPLDGMVIPLVPYKTVFHSTNTMEDAQYEISINGEMIAMVPPVERNLGRENETNLSYGEYLWEPPAPGTYLIEIRVSYEGEVSNNSASATVRVAEIPEPIADEVPAPEELPAEDAVILPIPIMFDTFMFYYFYGGSCDPQQEVTVDFMFAAPDIFNVVLFLRLEDVQTGEKTDWAGLAMSAIGDDYFRRTVASSQIPDADMFEQAYFQVQIVVTRADGSEIARTEVIRDQVLLLACGETPQPTAIPRPTTVPSPTPIPPPQIKLLTALV